MTRQTEPTDDALSGSPELGEHSPDQPEKTGPAPPVIDHLRGATETVHQAVEQLPFNRDLIGGDLAVDRYAAWLQTLRIIHRSLERAVDRCESPVMEHLWSTDRQRADLLVEDLERIGYPAEPADDRRPVEAFEAADRLGERLESATPVELAGALYVLEGATMGGMMIARKLESSSPRLAEATDFHTAYGKRTRQMWQQFTEGLDEAIREPEEIERCVDAAQETFWDVGQTIRWLSRDRA